jgi:glycosyltransferase involved in cell wall biosynthesis
MSEQPEVTVLLPCLNEAETLADCINAAWRGLRELGVHGEVLVADNGSTDGSAGIARNHRARVIDVPVRGYGRALIAGIAAAHGRYVIMADADGSYDIGSLASFVRQLRAGHDLVIGNRFRGGIAPGAMPPLHRYLGNPLLSGLGRRLFGIREVGDFHCGIRGLDRSRIGALRLCAPGMEFASEMIVRSALAGYRITEVPATLQEDGRSHRPHLRPWRDGWRHLRLLVTLAPALTLIPARRRRSRPILDGTGAHPGRGPLPTREAPLVPAPRHARRDAPSRHRKEWDTANPGEKIGP